MINDQTVEKMAALVRKAQQGIKDERQRDKVKAYLDVTNFCKLVGEPVPECESDVTDTVVSVQKYIDDHFADERVVIGVDQGKVHWHLVNPDSPLYSTIAHIDIKGM